MPHTSHLCPSLAWPSLSALRLGTPSGLSLGQYGARCGYYLPVSMENRMAVPATVFTESELSLPGLKDGQEVGRLNTWRPWASASRNTHAQGSLQDLFFFLISYKTTCPSQTGPCRPSPRHCGPSGEAPMNECLLTPEEPSFPLHRASMRKGVRLEVLSCPPQLLGEKADPGVSGALSAKNVRRYQTNVETPMMTATMRTVTDTQMAMKIFFFRAFFWFSRAILTCSCPRST